jgi:hypothetical protein
VASCLEIRISDLQHSLWPSSEEPEAIPPPDFLLDLGHVAPISPGCRNANASNIDLDADAQLWYYGTSLTMH